MSRNLPVNAGRIAEDIDALAKITEPDHPWTRRAFSPLFLEGRAYIEARMKAAGLETRMDAAGNLIAYLDLAKLPAGTLDPRSRLIMLYAMCGFANFGSLGIMIAGLTVMAPERRADIVSLGPKTIVSGTLTTCLMGAIVGVLN